MELFRDIPTAAVQQNDQAPGVQFVARGATLG